MTQDDQKQQDQKLLDRLARVQAPPASDATLPRPAPTRSTKPTEALAPGVLGARTGSPVVLHGGHLTHRFDHQKVVLEGAMNLELHITYVSDMRYCGYFGHNRCFGYERHLRRVSGDRWRLYLTPNL